MNCLLKKDTSRKTQNKGYGERDKSPDHYRNYILVKNILSIMLIALGPKLFTLCKHKK